MPAIDAIAPRLDRKRSRLAGIVRSASGVPLEGVDVCLLQEYEACCAPDRCTTSNAMGRFDLGEQTRTPVAIAASAEGYLPLRRSLRDRAEDEELVVTLTPGGVKVAGIVVDALGGRVAGALVSASLADELRPALAITAATGKFVLTVPPGDALIAAHADGYSIAERKVHAPADGIELVLAAASSLEGVVLTEGTHEPVGAVKVFAVGLNGVRLGTRAVETSELGRFRIGDLPAGAYSVVASSGEWRSEERRVVLEVAEDELVELFVTPATRLTGRVRVGESVCQQGSVRLEGPVPASSAVDMSGEVEFLGVLSGMYRAHVSCELGVDLKDEFEVGLEPIARDWALQEGLSVTGVVTTWSGVPLPGAHVEVEPDGEPWSRRHVACLSDERGKFSCPGLEPGRYRCQLRENAVPRSESVRVALSDDSAPPELVLRAYPTASVRAHIERSELLQLDAFALVAEREGAAPVIADRQGDTFVMEDIPIGTYDLRIEPEVPGGSRRVELARPDAVVEVSLGALEARVLSGRVVDEHGHGAPDVWVRVAGASLYGALRPASPVMTDAEGAFSIGGLLPGRYDLSATSAQGEASLDEVLNDGHPMIVPLRSRDSLEGSMTPGERASLSEAHGSSQR